MIISLLGGKGQFSWTKFKPKKVSFSKVHKYDLNDFNKRAKIRKALEKSQKLNDTEIAEVVSGKEVGINTIKKASEVLRKSGFDKFKQADVDNYVKRTGRQAYDEATKKLNIKEQIKKDYIKDRDKEYASHTLNNPPDQNANTATDKKSNHPTNINLPY